MSGVFMRTVDLTRARCVAGNLYFRARKTGVEGNLISVQLQPDGEDQLLIVTNYQIKPDEMIDGPALMEVFSMQLRWDERIVIRDLTTSPIAATNSISSKIGGAQGQAVPIQLNRLFGIPGKIAAKLTLEQHKITPESIITIAPRQKMHRLVRIGGDPGAEWDVEALRREVNQTNPWLEMPTPETDAPLQLFDEVRLDGGDGLPETPSGEAQLIGGALIHVNYEEEADGTLSDHGKVYRWSGAHRGGSWKTA